MIPTFEPNGNLPPTSFFSTGDNEEDLEDEDNASYESVLDECSNFMFGRTLKWHYRSTSKHIEANIPSLDGRCGSFPPHW